jgi:hypothetical protein
MLRMPWRATGISFHPNYVDRSPVRQPAKPTDFALSPIVATLGRRSYSVAEQKAGAGD